MKKKYFLTNLNLIIFEETDASSNELVTHVRTSCLPLNPVYGEDASLTIVVVWLFCANDRGHLGIALEMAATLDGEHQVYRVALLQLHKSE